MHIYGYFSIHGNSTIHVHVLPKDCINCTAVKVCDSSTPTLDYHVNIFSMHVTSLQLATRAHFDLSLDV